MNVRALFGFATSFGVTAAAVPVVCRLALRFELFDAPGPLKLHTRPIPRLGGVGLLLGFLIGCLATGVVGHRYAQAFLLSLLGLWFAGLWDDVRSLSPAVRLVVQFCAAALLASSVKPFSSSPLAFLGTCILVVITVNSFNFLDGSDGLAAGVAAVIAFGYMLTGLVLQTTDSALVASALLGCCLGFLVWNFPPARIFMGDSGSTALGFVISFLGLQTAGAPNASVPLFAIPFVFAALPLTDFLFSVLRRVRKGQSPLSGDRAHFYDRLLVRGWSPRRVALCSCLFTLGLLVVGLLFVVPQTVSESR